jgi:hypothetical protein
VICQQKRQRRSERKLGGKAEALPHGSTRQKYAVLAGLGGTFAKQPPEKILITMRSGLAQTE